MEALVGLTKVCQSYTGEVDKTSVDTHVFSRDIWPCEAEGEMKQSNVQGAIFVQCLNRYICYPRKSPS